MHTNIQTVKSGYSAPVISQAYPSLDLSIPTLKALWLEAAKL